MRLESHADGTVLRVRVSPGARHDRVIGPHGDAVKVSVSAPPEDGKANAAVLALLAGTLGIPERELELISGHTSRDKRVLVRGLTAEQVAEALESAGR